MLLNSRHSTLECLSNPRKIVHGIGYHILIKLILNKKIQLYFKSPQYQQSNNFSSGSFVFLNTGSKNTCNYEVLSTFKK